MSKDSMANQPTPNHPTPNQPINHDGFEQEDLSSRSALYFLAGLVLVCLVVYLIVFGMYRFLDSYATAHQPPMSPMRSEEHTSELQSRSDLVCRLLLETKKKK